MSRRAVLAAVATAVVVGGTGAPALAAVTAEPSVVCVVTNHDPRTGAREGVCVWVPVEPPLDRSVAR